MIMSYFQKHYERTNQNELNMVMLFEQESKEARDVLRLIYAPLWA